MARGRNRGFQKGRFLPTQIGGGTAGSPSCVLWLRADLGITIGTGVSTWADQSGYGNNVTQATGANQPTYNAADASFNGAPTITFASGQNLTKSSGFSVAQPYMAYAAVKYAGAAATSVLVGGTGAGSIPLYWDSTNVWAEQAASIVLSANGTKGPVALCATMNGASSNIYVQSSLSPTGSGTVGVGSLSGLSLGIYLNGSSFPFVGTLAEIIIYTGTHSQAQVAQIFNYFATRYGFVTPVPMTVPGLSLWLRADLGTTIATGVSQWNDQSGNGKNFTQATGATQPTLNASGGPNNQAYLNFNGSQYLTLAATLGVNASPWTMFSVQQSNGSGAECLVLSMGNVNNGYFYGVLPGSVNFMTVGGVATMGDGNVIANVWQDWTWNNNGAVTTMAVNGVPQALTNNTSQTPSVAPVNTVGALGAGSDPWNGNIAEILVYNAALSASQVTVVRNYLSARYGEVADPPLLIPGCQLWLRADRGITYVQGPVTSSGGSQPVVTLTGTPFSSANNIVITMQLPGFTGTATFSWSLNGVTQQTGVLTGSAVVLTGSGITAAFGAGVYTTGNTYSSVVTVSAWADLSGHGNNAAQATASQQPTYSAADANYGGQPSVVFTTASTQGLTSSFAVSQPDTIVIIGTSFTRGAGAGSAFIDTASGSRQLIWLNSSGVFQMYAGSFVGIAGNFLPHMFMAVYNGASSSLYVDNSQTAAASGNAGANNLASAGIAGIIGTDSLNGSIAEMIVYNGALGAAQLAQLSAYVKARYGLATS